LLLLATASGCGRGPSATAQLGPPKVSVGHPVVRDLVDEDDYNGWLDASQTVEVRARVRGYIQKVCFQDGDLVQRDQLLFELDPRPFQIAIDQGLLQARAFEAQRVAAEKAVVRGRELRKSGAVALEEMEKSEAEMLSYAAKVAATNEEVKRHQLDLEFSRIAAPIGGRIGRARLTEGNLVDAGGTDPVLTTIVAVNPVYVYFAIDERSLQRYQKSGGQRQGDKAAESLRAQKIPFQFGLDADEGYPRQGIIDFADNRVDPATGTIEVRGVAQDGQGMLTPGSRVRVRIPVSAKYPATLVPDTAVNTDQDQKYLLVVDGQNLVKRRKIRPGRLLDDGMRVVLSAQPELKKEDRIIVEGLQSARLNYPVEPIEDAAPPSGK
jgi:RND family efflux transporter MFP subunit